MKQTGEALAELFPEGDYRFHLGLRRGHAREFFGRQDLTGRILAERQRWLTAEPDRYAALRPEGESLLDGFRELVATWSNRSPEDEASGSATGSIHELGGRFEPDILLLSPDEEGHFRLRGGALCFPTGWALEEKLGHPLDVIHGVVPGLNAALGSSIHQFLARLKPDGAVFRDNWGLAATSELNLHPMRRIAAPSTPVNLESLWLRVEHQSLLALPASNGIVFGIRIALHRLDHVARTPAAAHLKHALRTMPPEVAAYKRLDAVRADLMQLL